MSSPSSIELFLSDWVLGRATPEDACRHAVRALQAGCTDESIAIIAGLDASTQEQIETELPRVLRAFDLRLPTRDEAMKKLVDDCARRIVDGEMDPLRSAWELYDHSVNLDESTEFWLQVRPIAELMLDETEADLVAGQRSQIIAAARAFLARGGLAVAGAR